MALTNFATLTTEEKTVWSRDLWMAARNASFVANFAGRGPNAMIQRITELTRTEKGARAVITLVTDLESDGVTGDYTLEDNEEEVKSYDQVIRIDQLRQANRHAGRLADQKSIVNFRNTSRDVLGYYYGDRLDQMAFLTMAGIDYVNKNDGGVRPVNPTGQNLGDLEYAADVTGGTANRYKNWNAGGAGLVTADLAADTITAPSYDMLIELKAFAKTHYIRGIKGPNNSEFYHVFMHPQGLAQLKQETDFRLNLQNAGVRGTGNPLFSGGLITQDGLIIHEHRHVPTTLGAASGSKWGNGGTTDGQALLFCGAQALGMADLGLPYWVEENFDYGNQQGISVGKMYGFLKPVFRSIYDDANEDFGVIRCNTSI
jgi:N4-gp56 family major capsid protein